MNNEYYVYVYLNQLKPGIWIFKDLEFNYQPFYVGKGKGFRYKSHLCKSNLKKNSPKNNTIKKIIKECEQNPFFFIKFMKICLMMKLSK